jgi:hypothetical protein
METVIPLGQHLYAAALPRTSDDTGEPVEHRSAADTMVKD